MTPNLECVIVFLAPQKVHMCEKPFFLMDELSMNERSKASPYILKKIDREYLYLLKMYNNTKKKSMFFFCKNSVHFKNYSCKNNNNIGVFLLERNRVHLTTRMYIEQLGLRPRCSNEHPSC